VKKWIIPTKFEIKTMARKPLLTWIGGIVGVFCCLSCNPEPQTAPSSQENPGEEMGYFSINQYIEDQWAIYKGQAFPITQYTYLNGQEDSSYTHALDLPWGDILRPFIESDISDPQWVGQYAFSSFYDDITQTQSYYYEAEDPELFTRRLQIMVDPFSQKIQSLFIETHKNSFWTSRNRKLLYIPLQLIRIQDREDHFVGPSKDFRVEYRFR